MPTSPILGRPAPVAPFLSCLETDGWVIPDGAEGLPTDQLPGRSHSRGRRGADNTGDAEP